MSKRTALIIGAGPAGLTAAFELVTRSDITPVVLEKSDYLGGLSRTVLYKGNRIDIGGHRFFSKSDRVMDWWLARMPLEKSEDASHTLTYQRKTRSLAAQEQGVDPASADRVMLIRRRKSRIYFLRQFFDYPIHLNPETLKKLGLWRTFRIGASYFINLLRPHKPEVTLEQFFINRFGRELYFTFFKSYTEKVWGMSCDKISAEWGMQRIKGLSAYKAVTHFIRTVFPSRKEGDVWQKETETSLIEKFLYPKFGPGQLWESVAEDVKRAGGSVETGWHVERLHCDGFRITAADAVHGLTGERRTIKADYFFSTMPVRELIESLAVYVPDNVTEVAQGLIYRDFITVGILLSRLKVEEKSEAGAKLLSDNWIYIQEPDVKVGRMQIFNNWSPYLVASPGTVWIGLEYFCYATDTLWAMSDADIAKLAKQEAAKIGMIDENDVLDACVIRMPKTYPAYFGTYGRFGEIVDYLERFENLYLIGRNGMHKYNNQDHSMLTAMTAVDNILEGRRDKSNIWALNSEMEYHETRK